MQWVAGAKITICLRGCGPILLLLLILLTLWIRQLPVSMVRMVTRVLLVILITFMVLLHMMAEPDLPAVTAAIVMEELCTLAPAVIR
jgi:hypothetical protein